MYYPVVFFIINSVAFISANLVKVAPIIHNKLL